MKEATIFYPNKMLETKMDLKKSILYLDEFDLMELHRIRRLARITFIPQKAKKKATPAPAKKLNKILSTMTLEELKELQAQLEAKQNG